MFGLLIIEIAINSLNLRFESDLDVIQENIRKIKINSDDKFDRRTKKKYYLDNVQIHGKENIVPYVPIIKLYNYGVSKGYSFFPLSGKSNTVTILCNEGGFWANYKSDRYGFNNDDDFWNKSKDVYLIGDSFVHGSCVKTEHNIANQLKNLTNKNFLNLGMGDTGFLAQFAIFKEYIDEKNKKIIWFFFEGNDLSNTEKETKNPILKKYFTDINFYQDIRSYNKIKDTLSIDLIEKTLSDDVIKQKKNIVKPEFNFKNIIKLQSIRSFALNSFIKASETDNKKNLIVFKEVLSQIKKYIEQQEHDVTFVFLPAWERYNKFRYNDKKKIINIFNELDLKIIDIDKLVFNLEDNNQYFPFGLRGHYNSNGYKIISKKLVEIIKF